MRASTRVFRPAGRLTSVRQRRTSQSNFLESQCHFCNFQSVDNRHLAHVSPFAQASEAFSYGTPNFHQTSGFLGARDKGKGRREGRGGVSVWLCVCVRETKSLFFVSTVSDLRNCAATR